MQHTYAVILAGGVGARVGREIPKQFLPIKNKPMIAWTIEAFHKVARIDGILVVSPEDYIDKMKSIVASFRLKKVIDIVNGGTTRQGSVYNALISRRFDDDDVLLFHDAARPFVSVEIISKCIDEAARSGAAGTYIPATDTITEIESNLVKTTLPRKTLYYTQTPQGFKYRIIRDAHEKALAQGITDATDDITLVIGAGYTAAIVRGEDANIKITSPHDYALAEHILEYCRKNEQ